MNLCDARRSIVLLATNRSGAGERRADSGLEVPAMLSKADNRLAGAAGTSMTLAAVGLFCLLGAACTGTPTQPRDTALPTGRWTGDGACLSVAVDGCDLVVGCAHGQFAQPDVHGDGTFEVNGTYRIEAGPISINPAPPATFSGVVKGQTLTLSVMPGDPSLRPASYVLQLTNGRGKCAVPCL
jgi:hypothetical protein